MPLRRPLAESVVVITGASAGIGAATALELSRRGATVVLAARRVEALAAVARGCAEAGGRAIVVPTDVTDPAAVVRLADRAVAEFGHLDAWVNNAAVALYAPVFEAPLPQVRRVVETNVLGCLHGVQAAVPKLRAAGGGVIVNVGSALAIVSVPNMGSYNLTMHAVLGLSNSLRQDLRAAGETQISVCTVLPASIDTPFYHHAGNRTGVPPQPIPPVYPPETAARTIVRLIRRPRRQAYAGGAARALAWQWRLLPGPTEQLLTWYVLRTQFRSESAAPTDGNLYTGVHIGLHAGLHPAQAPPAGVDGGWHGRRRTTLRRLAFGVAAGLAAAGTATAARRRSQRP